MKPDIVILAAGLVLLAGPAGAAARIVSYDSSSPEARRLTGAGLTFVMDRSWIGRVRLEQVRATAVPVTVRLDPADLTEARAVFADRPSEEVPLSAWKIRSDADQGQVMAQAFCGAGAEVWLATGRFAHGLPLEVEAIGKDKATGAFFSCARMTFSWRGEWRVPGRDRKLTEHVFAQSVPTRR